MIKAKFPLFILLLSGIIWISCDKKVVYPSQNNFAPFVGNLNDTNKATNPITTPNGPLYYGYPTVWYYRSLSVTYSGNLLSIYGSDTAISGGCLGYTSIALVVRAKDTGTYVLSNNNYAMNSSWGWCNSLVGFTFYTDSARTGTIHITLLDTINHITSGTYKFVAEEQMPFQNGGSDTVTKGHFIKLHW